MRLRHLAALPLAAALAFAPLLASPANAAHPTGKPATSTAKKTPAAKPTHKPQPAKPTKPANAASPFSATGTLTSVNPTARTVTVLVKGGKNARGTSLTIAVSATARINLNDAPSNLAALPTGAHVAVRGTLNNTTRTATRINAESNAVPTPTTPTTPTTPQPTTNPTPTSEPTSEPTA